MASDGDFAQSAQSAQSSSLPLTFCAVTDTHSFFENEYFALRFSAIGTVEQTEYAFASKCLPECTTFTGEELTLFFVFCFLFYVFSEQQIKL